MATIFRACRDHWKNNMLSVRAGQITGLHQMRVGLRRFRTALLLFRDYLPAAHYEYFAAEAKVVNRSLGKLRDLDVFIGTLNGLAAGKLAKDPHVVAVIAAATSARARARHAVAAALRGTRYRRFMSLLDKWLEGERWRTASKREKDGRKAARAFARKALKKHFSRMRKRAKRIDEASGEAVHNLRIAAKNARYAFEFLGSSLRARGVKRAERRVRQLQDTLGQVNDAAMAKQLMKEFTSAAAKEQQRRALKAGRRKLSARRRAMHERGLSNAVRVSTHLRAHKLG